MKYAIFGDETTIPPMLSVLGESVAISVAATNRPESLKNLKTKVLFQPKRNTHEHALFIRRLSYFKPDVILCFSYSMKLDPQILAIPKCGAINIHGGLLPQHRGANVLNWVLIEGLKKTGVTAHFMNNEIDAGAIIYQKEVSISNKETALTLKAKLDTAGLKMISDIHETLSAGRMLDSIPQDLSKIKYYKRRYPEDGKIDWSSTDREIYNLVRALVHPWPGAWYINAYGQKIILDQFLTLDEVHKIRVEQGFDDS